MERQSEDQRERARTGGTDDEEIRRRAYEIYESRGGTPGNDMDDWLAAERELREPRSASGSDRDSGTDEGAEDGRGAGGARRGTRARGGRADRPGRER